MNSTKKVSTKPLCISNVMKIGKSNLINVREDDPLQWKSSVCLACVLACSFNSCVHFCHSSDKRLYFADNSGNEHDSTKLVQGTPSEISWRNFWYNKNFSWVKFLGSISGGSRPETEILPVTGNHFLTRFMQWPIAFVIIYFWLAVSKILSLEWQIWTQLLIKK